jgi:hypothetical protein
MTMSRSIRFCTLLSTTALAFAGCAVEDEGAILGDDELPITGGTLVTSNVAPFNSVVRISTSVGGCTATKIGARRFLTAAHCVPGLVAGDDVRITNALDGTFTASDRFTIAAVDAHPTRGNDFDDGNHRRSYDVAVIEITANTPAIPTLGVRAAFLPDATSGTTVGYGCDLSPGDADHGGQKQRATFTTTSLDDLEADPDVTNERAYRWHTLYAVHAGGAAVQTCPGDSGGPLLVRSGDVWQVAAVTSRHIDSYSFQSRVGGVSRWIADPAVNDIVAGSDGWLVNDRSNLCVGIGGGSVETDADAGTYYCDGRRGTTDNQYWTLVRNGSSGTFRIRNGKSGLCLGVAGASTAHGARVAQYECTAADGDLDHQAWRFQDVASGTPRIVNARSNRCLGVDGDSLDRGALLRQQTCATNESQRWLFVR